MTFPINLIIEALCLAAAVVFLRKERTHPWRSLPFYVLFVVLIEGTGWLLREYSHQNNQWLYNVSAPAQVVFLYWLFYRTCPKRFKSGFFLSACTVIFLAAYFLELCHHGIATFNRHSWTFFSFSSVVASGLYYYFLLADDAYTELSSHAPFWLVTGVFVYFLGSTACNLFFDELMRLNITQGYSLRYLLFVAFNFILYSCWSYAFLCRYKQVKLHS